MRAEPRRRNSSSTCTADDVANRRVTGLKAKGNIEVDMSWENGKLVEARVKGMRIRVCGCFMGREMEVRLEEGKVDKVEGASKKI